MDHFLLGFQYAYSEVTKVKNSKLDLSFCWGALGAMFMFAQCAHAGFVPPDYRGGANSTLSTWSASGGWLDGSNANGTFVPAASNFPLSQAEGGCGAGQHCLKVLGGDLEFFIPNFVDPLPIKLLRVQFKWSAGTSTVPVLLDPPAQVVAPIESGDPAGAVIATLVERSVATLDNGFYFNYQDFRLTPNPDWEKITADNSAQLGLVEVVIDTISVPEPATLLLVSAAMLGLGHSRRRDLKGKVAVSANGILATARV